LLCLKFLRTSETHAALAAVEQVVVVAQEDAEVIVAHGAEEPTSAARNLHRSSSVFAVWRV
jgi:hypothetical protein